MLLAGIAISDISVNFFESAKSVRPKKGAEPFYGARMLLTRGENVNNVLIDLPYQRGLFTVPPPPFRLADYLFCLFNDE